MEASPAAKKQVFYWQYTILMLLGLIIIVMLAASCHVRYQQRRFATRFARLVRNGALVPVLEADDILEPVLENVTSVHEAIVRPPLGTTADPFTGTFLAATGTASNSKISTAISQYSQRRRRLLTMPAWLSRKPPVPAPDSHILDNSETTPVQLGRLQMGTLILMPSEKGRRRSNYLGRRSTDHVSLERIDPLEHDARVPDLDVVIGIEDRPFAWDKGEIEVDEKEEVMRATTPEPALPPQPTYYAWAGRTGIGILPTDASARTW